MLGMKFEIIKAQHKAIIKTEKVQRKIFTWVK